MQTARDMMFMFVLIFSGPVHAMVLERHDAVTHWRALIGPTDARKAKTSHPNRLRTTALLF
jgi:nucleoside diphosphate kinase